MSYLIRRAGVEDGDAILDLVSRTPQEGLLHLNFERDPDFYLGSFVSCEEPDVWVAEDSTNPGHVVAVINIGSRIVHINGVPQRIRYGHDLRIDPSHRGGMLLHRIFRRLRQELGHGEWMQTVILDGNETSMSTVGSGRAGMPVYYPHGEIETHLVYTGRQRKSDASARIRVRRAAASDISVMQEFLDDEGRCRQFFPRYQLQRLLADDRYYFGLRPENFLLALDGEQIVGIAGDWDQKAFKRTRVIAYPDGLRWVRCFYNLVSVFLGGMKLPATGDCFHYRSLHTVVVRNNDANVFSALLDAALADNRDCDAIVCGFFSGDPLTDVLTRYRRRVMRSLHFLVCYDGDPRESLDPSLQRYVDVARL